MKDTMQYNIDHLSASQLNIFSLCSLKYKFQYIDKLPRPFKSSGLAFGSVMHSALEWFHKERVKGNTHSLQKLLKIFDADWFSQTVEADIRYKKGETEKSLRHIGKQMLTQYFHSDHTRPVDAEVSFSLPLVNLVTRETLEPRIEGFIDLIGKEHVLVEFKTSARTMNAADLKDNIQLSCYSYAYELLYQARPRRLKVINFVKTKIPKIVVLETQRSSKDLERFFHLAKVVLSGIQAGIFFPRATFMCKDCEYSMPCRQWQGNGR
jgi:putative RecB family exonuclease